MNPMHLILPAWAAASRLRAWLAPDAALDGPSLPQWRSGTSLGVEQMTQQVAVPFSGTVSRSPTPAHTATTVTTGTHSDPPRSSSVPRQAASRPPRTTPSAPGTTTTSRTPVTPGGDVGGFTTTPTTTTAAAASSDRYPNLRFAPMNPRPPLAAAAGPVVWARYMRFVDPSPSPGLGLGLGCQ